MKQEWLCIPVYVCTNLNSVMDIDIILTKSGNNKSSLAYLQVCICMPDNYNKSEAFIITLWSGLERGSYSLSKLSSLTYHNS